ncbi:hypothetical protein HEK616_26990 [Streptomyces nigrescens]|uniref:Uncharacterized protein n=2 Tax=Streptomyces TaxID=1883 RepID=A0ABM7ZSA4_STRNI|nr:hypothetical protein [Streptomyces nigrescens]MEE4418431.1 hypothetical protein [Streptomyces sp. DSM 41528]BDM69212.1 hypothetical protein HEK616_26990 [Streptomyces nigrescens]
MSTTPEAGHAGHEHIHRFLILGKKNLFFYHLALYNPQSGHNYQAVFTFTIKDSGELRDMYLKDLAQHESERVFYSLRCPHHFELPELQQGKVFRVHLERVVVDKDGKRDFQQMTTTETEVECKKEDVRYFRKLGDLPYPEYLTYLMFGEGDEIHLAHQLAARPNWDEAVTISPASAIDPATLKKVPTFVIESIKDAHDKLIESPLKKGQQYQGKLNGNGTNVDFTVGRQGWWNHTSLNS